jgi:hypothetical protein
MFMEEKYYVLLLKYNEPLRLLHRRDRQEPAPSTRVTTRWTL